MNLLSSLLQSDATKKGVVSWVNTLAAIECYIFCSL